MVLVMDVLTKRNNKLFIFISMNLAFENSYITMEVSGSPESDVIQLKGRVKNMESYKKVTLIAANPIDRMTSYSGSGLPFPCASIAFQNSQNKHEVQSSDGSFYTNFLYPNSYNSLDAMELIGPSIFAVFYTHDSSEPTYVRFELPQRAPLQVRSLVHRPKRTDPMFYYAKQDIIGIHGAEATMRRWSDVKLFNGLA